MFEKLKSFASSLINGKTIGIVAGATLVGIGIVKLTKPKKEEAKLYYIPTGAAILLTTAIHQEFPLILKHNERKMLIDSFKRCKLIKFQLLGFAGGLIFFAYQRMSSSKKKNTVLIESNYLSGTIFSITNLYLLFENVNRLFVEISLSNKYVNLMNEVADFFQIFSSEKITLFPEQLKSLDIFGFGLTFSFIIYLLYQCCKNKEKEDSLEQEPEPEAL